MNYKELKESGYKLFTTSLFRGYISAKITDDNVKCVPYNGRYGKGYKVQKHNPNSTQYALVEYWVK